MLVFFCTLLYHLTVYLHGKYNLVSLFPFLPLVLLLYNLFLFCSNLSILISVYTFFCMCSVEDLQLFFIVQSCIV